MRNLIAISSLLLAMLACSAYAADDASLTIELSGLSEAEGNVYIAVYDNPEDWLGDEVAVGVEVSITEALVDEMVVASLDLPPGEYAISIYYDANGNGELDTNFIGIPKEPVALSNNAKAKFGPPKYKDAVFTLSAEGLTQRIQMNEI
jgi:uncharacterized protein (DUF2141 family)